MRMYVVNKEWVFMAGENNAQINHVFYLGTYPCIWFVCLDKGTWRDYSSL